MMEAQSRNGGAQPQVARLIARADSLAGTGDSASALAALDSALALDRRAAAAWHRKGHIAWRLAHPDSTSKIDWNARTIRLMRQADSALRYATIYAPDSAAYHLTLANYLLSNTMAMVRFSALGVFERAAEAGRRSGDSIVTSEALDRAGMRHWRHYEPLMDRVAPGGIENPDFELYLRDEKERTNFLENFAPRASTPLGEIDYARAVASFGEALGLNPHNGMARRHVFMALASRRRWEELRDAARARLAQSPWDPWGWLALGLATHRGGGDPRVASAAFDSAIVLLSPQEQRHFTRLSRLLGEKDSARFAGMSEPQRLRAERLYWVVADPLALTPGNEYWLEFLSRVTLAELLFTVEEFGIRGANTDRGAVLIRYGPPDLSLSFPPDLFGRVGLLWNYRNGLAFAFTLMPSFGTAEAVFEARDVQEEHFNRFPARWDNLAVTRRMDSITTLITRFRSGDSSDVVVAAEIPTGRMARGIDLASGTLRLGLVAFGTAANLLARDTASLQIPLQASDSMRVLRRSWRYRLATAPEIGYRVEALQSESGNAARAVGALELPPGVGFGLSDVLLADSVRSPGGVPRRWRDLAAEPNAGRIRRGRALALVWETYALAADSLRSNAYRVDIGLERTDGSRIGRAVARVLSGTLGRGEGRGRDDRVTVSFDRKVPARAVTLDYLTLDLGDLAPGRYRLTITVTDLVASATTSSERELTIVR
jgi:GWxTD domain-containing protein